MPSRKSNASVVAAPPAADEQPAETTPARAGKEAKSDGFSVDDISLPKSMIARLAKGVLPPNTSIQKDALLALHKSATVFVNYIASNANDHTQSAGKKTISPQDVMAALKDTEFEGFIPRLEEELAKYSSNQNTKRNTYRQKVKDSKTAAATENSPTNGNGTHTTNGEETSTDGDAAQATASVAQGKGIDHDDDVQRPFKKFKAQNGVAIDPEADVNGDEDGDEGESEQEVYEHEEDEVEDEVDDEDGEEGNAESSDDEEMHDAVDELEAQAGIRDEALDDPDSD